MRLHSMTSRYPFIDGHRNRFMAISSNRQKRFLPLRHEAERHKEEDDD
jgi:hypothetical protein